MLSARCRKRRGDCENAARDDAGSVPAVYGRSRQTAGARRPGRKSKITIPWFAILFILVAVFNSFHLLPKPVVDMLVTLDTVLLAMAMAALGLTTHVSALKKPVLNRC